MNPAPVIYCVTVEDTSDNPEGAAELFNALELDFSSWRDEETKHVRHTVYFPGDSGEADAAAFRERLETNLIPMWREFGVELEDPRTAEIRKEDWAESWKIHFKTMVISPRIVVRPSWEQYAPEPGQHVIVLDPGMSFGTGQHATTKSCIAAIDRFAAEFPAGTHPSFLDAGCGSGILAIAAHALGCAPVDAFDIDPDVIPIARENAQINGIPDAELSLSVSSLLDYRPGRTYDIVAANILSSALIEGREHLVSLVRHGGILILAGILTTEYPTVRDAFAALGCVELGNSTEREWTGGSFRVP